MIYIDNHRLNIKYAMRSNMNAANQIANKDHCGNCTTQKGLTHRIDTTYYNNGINVQTQSTDLRLLNNDLKK